MTTSFTFFARESASTTNEQYAVRASGATGGDGRVAEHRDDDALPELRSSLRATHVGAAVVVELRLPGLPAQGDAHRLEPGVLLGEDDGLRVLRPLEVVIGDAR